MKTCYFLRKKKWSSIMIFEYNVIIFPFNEWIISREKMYVIHISTHQIQLRLKKQSMWKLMTQWKIKSGKRVNLMKTNTLGCVQSPSMGRFLFLLLWDSRHSTNPLFKENKILHLQDLYIQPELSTKHN